MKQPHCVRPATGAWALIVALSLGVGGCAQVTEGSLLLLSSRTPAIALVNGQLLQGEVQLFPDRTGTATLTARPAALSAADAARINSCIGPLRYTSSAAGVIDLRCNGGVSVELAFTTLSDTRGFAYSKAPEVPVSLTYGLTVQEAVAYLKLPEGKRLVVRPGSAEVELR